MTRKQYNTRKAELENKLNAIRTQLENTEACALLPGDGWNDLHDAEYETEQEIKSLENEWDRRNWTAQDHYQFSLICENID